MNRSGRVWVWAIVAATVVSVSTVAGDPLPRQPVPENDGSPESSPATSGKSAPPGADELQRARKEIRTVLRDEFSKAKTNDDKISLALVLFDHAKKTLNDQVSKYALLDEAREAAASAGQSELALKAIDALIDEFDIDGIGMKTESLVETSKHLKDADDRQAFVEVTLRVAEDAVDADDFEHALKLASAAQSVAAKARDADLKKRAAGRLSEFKKLQKEWESLAEARETLEASPDDPGANARVGRYLCLLRGDWEHGLPLLARGEDKKFAPLAERESAIPVETEERIKLADDWWTAAQGEPPAVKDRVQTHAADLYSRVLPQLEGISKVRIEKRLASLEGKDRPKKSKKQQVQLPELVGNPQMPVNPVMPARRNDRPVDYDFERKFAQRLKDKGVTGMALRGARNSISGHVQSLPDYPFYIESFDADEKTTVDDSDFADVERLHGLNGITIRNDKLTDRSVVRIARNGTLRTLRLGANSRISLKTLQSCPDIETLDFSGECDVRAIVAAALSLPRLQWLRLETVPLKPLDITGLSRLPNLQSLDLKLQSVNRDAMSELVKCRALRRLSIRDAEIRPSPDGLPQLNSLTMWDCQVDRSLWKQLQALAGLSTLHVQRGSISDDDLQYLPGSLQSLMLLETTVTGDGFRKHRAGFARLSNANLTRSPVTDAGLDALLKLAPGVTGLSLDQTQIGAAGLRLAPQLNALQFVTAQMCRDPDGVLKALGGAPASLQRVHGNFSPDAIAKFKQTHTNCNVTQ